MVKVENLSISFGGVKALSNISYTFPDNVIVGVIGTNGAGKTTLLNVISGMIKPDSGTVWYDEENITNLEPNIIASKGLIRTFQSSMLFNDLSVEDNILLGLIKKHNLKTSLKTIREENIDLIFDYFDKLSINTNYLKKYPHEIPYGIKRLIEIVRIILFKPKVIFFDEPTTGLTQKEISKLFEFLLFLKEKENINYIFGIEHNLKFLFEIVDELILMDKGEIIFIGSEKELFLAKPEYKNFL